MLQKEFESLVGVCVSPRLYSLVERYYMLTSFSKQEFVSRHFASCSSEFDVYTCLKKLAVDYYSDRTLFLREVYSLACFDSDGVFCIS